MITYTLCLTPFHTKTCQRFSFVVEEGTKEILLQGDYQPREVSDPILNRELILPAYERYGEGAEVLLSPCGGSRESDYVVESFSPIRNLLDYTLWDPKGKLRMVGGGSFFSVKQISEESVSIGGVEGELLLGVWTLLIEVKMVVTPSLDVTMQVQLNKEVTKNVEKSAVYQREALQLATLSGVRKERAKARWYKGDLHVHSHHSDGSSSLYELVEFFTARAYDFFLLSDHNIYTGCQEKIPEDYPLVVLKGVEMTTFYGHVLLANFPYDCNWQHFTQDEDFEEFITELSAKDALVGVAHPYAMGDPICTGCRFEYPNLKWELTHFLEVWNGPWMERKIEILQALRLWESLLNKGIRITATSGSDLHGLGQERRTLASTYIFAEDLTEGALLSSLRQGKVFLSQGPLMEFHLLCPSTGERVSLGEELLAPCKHVQAEIRVDSAVVVELVRQGERVYKEHLEGGKELLLMDVLLLDEAWYVVKIWDEENTLLGLTNPIYVKTRDAILGSV